MKILRILLVAILSLFGALVLSSGALAEKLPRPDVRLLIDISGSMKDNDPKNLRIPALQLVTNLMPQGADAGVWAFGRYVNMMVPLSVVDSAWQEKATLSAQKINSAGLYTNIGGVMEKASYGWTVPDPEEKRSLILLTDGMVDIAKDKKVNQQERARILTKILPELMAADVTIHTIALSQNADHELLKTLASQTDGWYQAVDNAEDLQRVFLKIFEQSAARDALPLVDNQFKVDASIEEMTLLVFKQSNNEKARLIAPNEKVFEKTTKDGLVRWFSTPGYDLITVKEPLPGDWQIDAQVDPDNRVMVVSNLKLNVSPVPNNLLAGEAIDYRVALVEDSKTITKPDFLSLVSAQLQQSKGESSTRLAMLYDSNEHVFRQNFFTDNNEGVLNLTLLVKSPTFERTRNHAVNVYGSPLTHQVEVSTTGDQPHILALSVRDDIVEVDSLQVTASIAFPDGEKQFLVLDELNQPIEIRTLPSGGDYSVSLDIKGKSNLGRDFSVSPEPILFTALPTQAFLDAQQVVVANETPVIPVEAPQPTEVASDVTEQTAPELEVPEEADGTLWVYVGLGGNLILVLLGVFGWRIMKKRKQQGTAALANELGIEEIEDANNNPDAEVKQ